MTVDECRERIDVLRQAQGTARPLIRVEYAGTAYRGRLARIDGDRDRRLGSNAPCGVLVLEEPGLVRAAHTVLQIAGIPENGIVGFDDH